jgi:hypothetical protein
MFPQDDPLVIEDNMKWMVIMTPQCLTHDIVEKHTSGNMAKEIFAKIVDIITQET